MFFVPRHTSGTKPDLYRRAYLFFVHIPCRQSVRSLYSANEVNTLIVSLLVIRKLTPVDYSVECQLQNLATPDARLLGRWIANVDASRILCDKQRPSCQLTASS